MSDFYNNSSNSLHNLFLWFKFKKIDIHNLLFQIKRILADLFPTRMF